MATQYPISIEDMTKITGVSEGKAKRYGRDFIDLIADYVEQNDIERPDDFVVKQVANKSRTKVSIIQGIDKKLPLDEIADTINLSMEDLMNQDKCDFMTQMRFKKRLIDIIESVAWWYVWGEEKAKLMGEQNNRWQYYAESVLNLYKDTNQVPDTLLPPGWKIIN